MFEADMHTHSYYSDGTISPREIVKRAKERGLKAVCLSDHDIWQGWPEFEAALKEFGLRGLPAIEFTAVCNGRQLHILGYGIDLTKSKIIESIVKDKSWKYHYQRVAGNLEALARSGGPNLSVEQMKEIVGAHGPSAFITWFRNYLIRFQNMTFADARTTVIRGGKYFAEPDKSLLVDSELIISMIRALNGAPFWAHTGKIYKKDPVECDAIFHKMRNQGLAGLEANHYHNETCRDYLLNLAKQHRMLITGGSDYHAENNPYMELGQYGVTMEEYEQIEALVS